MADHLKSQVIGQDEAIDALTRAIKRAKAGLKDPGRPIGSFIFLGPSGVGKTELAKKLAEFLFGDEANMIRIDMSEYTEKHTTSRLIGSPPGYVGHDEGGQLTEPVRRKPYSIVLFDEIEKAASEVHNILLQVMDDGILSDSNGRKVDFKNTVIVMTSNVGSNLIRQKSSFGFISDSGKDRNVYDKMKETVLEELKREFTPEFLNRIDDTIIFQILSKENLSKIVRLMLKELNKRLDERKIQLKLSDSVMDFIVDQGFVENQGARPLRTAIQNLVENKLADMMLKGELPENSVVEGVVNGKEIDFIVKEISKDKGKGRKKLVTA
jgi:ATP-dependent Clp protease ATP-binding subunit ClpC